MRSRPALRPRRSSLPVLDAADVRLHLVHEPLSLGLRSLGFSAERNLGKIARVVRLQRREARSERYQPEVLLDLSLQEPRVLAHLPGDEARVLAHLPGEQPPLFPDKREQRLLVLDHLALDGHDVVAQGVQVFHRRHLERRLRLARVIGDDEIAEPHPNLLGDLRELGHVLGPQRRRRRVNHGAAVAVPRVVRAPVVHEHVLAVLVPRHVPVVPVVEVLVAVVVHNRRSRVVGVKRLHVGPLVKLTVRTVNAPVDLHVHVTLVGRAEEVLLAVEDVEVSVQPGDDVPPAFLSEDVCVEVWRHRVRRRRRVLARVLLLLDAVLVTDRARVERLHRLGGVQVPALDLAVRLVGLAETTLEAHEGLCALLVG
mmetsp:Transcript_476/g.1847  ORF Transcript_476/g.1847 Transcript_476/m.1847 type:complete len:369 (+) Transcript_476:49-1155(+)